MGTVVRAAQALADERRVKIVRHISTEDETTVGELAQALPGDVRDNRISLRHIHLPKLAAMEYVEWEEEDVRQGPRFAELSDFFANAKA